MAVSNAERIGKGLELLKQGLTPFVERELRAVYGDEWATVALRTLQATHEFMDGKSELDVHALLVLMWGQWNEVFRKTLGHTERTYVSELRVVRNDWAHQKTFSSDDTDRGLDTMVRLLNAVSAGQQATEVERSKQELRRTVYEEQARRETRKVARVSTLEGTPNTALKPWRELITPHKDVMKGTFRQAEFAADLWQVFIGEGASSEYMEPTEFFRRTYLTDGLKGLLTNAIKRLSGRGGDPVVELQTNFGGGKTHSMLALYHLFSGKSLTDLPGLEPVLEQVGSAKPSGVKRVVLVGNKISPGQPSRKADGTVVRTLWGEIAYQLGRREGFEMLREADETSTNPGDTLRQLFVKYGPCLILIDEWVAYARQLHTESDLPGGSFETHFTFAQTLTEAAKAAPNTLLIVSIPSSDSNMQGQPGSHIEVGGERGQLALERLKNAIGRLESAWRPASSDESFEIVRRRLFQEMNPDQYPQRDAVIKACMSMYRDNAGEFPAGTREAEYERRMRAAYPIHPELFERLYTDWSSLEKFQRTRGVLRLMAAVIHELWKREDKSLLILPATVPIDAAPVQSELTRYLEDNWLPVLEKDVDGPDSLPLKLDGEYPNLGRYSACRRVARTLYLGSAPTLRLENKGVTSETVKLGCVQPGETVSTFGDALRRLSDQATHLYINNERYWYATQPSVSRLAQDRAGELSEDAVFEEIRERLQTEAKARADFARVHVMPDSSSDVPNEPGAALVILGPGISHSARAKESPAHHEAASILETRGSGARTYKNTLVFLAVDAARYGDLEGAVRAFLAWRSVEDDAKQENLNLDTFQRNQAKTKAADAEKTLVSRVPEAYQWLLIPSQPDPRGPIIWEEVRLTAKEGLVVRTAKRLRADDYLITVLAGTLLKRALDTIPLWRGDHVGLKQLSEDFTSYLYLPRLRDSTVLLEAVKDGLRLLTWSVESFAYADGYDAEKGRYIGLRTGDVPLDLNKGLLVQPDAATKQLEAERVIAESTPVNPTSAAEPTYGAAEPTPPPSQPRDVQLKRFYGSARLDPTRFIRDANSIGDAVVQHLNGLAGAEVELVLKIRARFDTGAPENVVRTVTENSRTLKFSNAGFEEE